MFDLKIFFIILSIIAGLSAFFPYLRDIFSLKTKPHIYTWLIWSVTQGTAVAGIYYGGGGLGGLELVIGTFFVFIVFLFSLKYGTKNITKSDTAVLITAFLAVLVWWQLHQPLLSVLMVSAIDVIGYIPSIRKSYKDPWSETLSTWILFIISNVTAILALSNYNLLTMAYLSSITVADVILIAICLYRRQFVVKR